MGGGGYKLKVKGTDSYPVNERKSLYFCLEPMYAEALNNLGNLLRREGRTDQAERVLRH